ncbi:hypothetical protein [Rhodococcus koreensis]|uniref:hypothetical protein n=1 Tax=Rhodococcus koreensis TaxID=99653 RepID=UPI0036720E06
MADELCVEEPLLELHPVRARTPLKAAPTAIIFFTCASNQTNWTGGIDRLNDYRVLGVDPRKAVFQASIGDELVDQCRLWNQSAVGCVQPDMDELIAIAMWNCEMVQWFFDHGIEKKRR